MSTKELRDASMVERCHTVRTIRHQTVAEHSFGVCMLLWKLCDREPSDRLLKAALFHDLPEWMTGDVPAPAKWQSPMLKQELKFMEDDFNKRYSLEVCLSPQEELLLKWADSLELGWYAVDELMMGNRHMDIVYQNIARFLEELEPIKNCLNELNQLKTQYAIAITR